MRLEGGYKKWERDSASFLPKRTRMISLRLSPEEVTLLKKVAKAKGTTVSSYIISAVLEKSLQDHEYLEGTP